MGLRSRLGVGVLRVSHWMRASIPSLLPAGAAVEYNAYVFGRLLPVYIAAADDGLADGECRLMDRFHVQSGRALCLGCGTGRESFALARRGLDVVGVDQVQAFVDHATALADTHHLSATFLRADYSQFDLPGQTFDYAFLLNCAFSYLPTRQRRRALLTRLRGLLNPGGLCMLHYVVREPDDDDRRLYPVWRRLARLSGNRDYEFGDRITMENAFTHCFSSDDDVRVEAEACGFRRMEFSIEDGSHFAVLFA
jgi:SAM-dependent methyltransferase